MPFLIYQSISVYKAVTFVRPAYSSLWLAVVVRYLFQFYNTFGLHIPLKGEIEESEYDGIAEYMNDQEIS